MRDNFIREWRKDRLGWSQERLAAEATEVANRLPRASDAVEPYSWGRTDVNRYENGKREPPLAFMRAVASMCAVTVDDILGRRPTDPAPVPPHLRDLDPVWRDVSEEDRETALRVLRQFKG